MVAKEGEEFVVIGSVFVKKAVIACQFFVSWLNSALPASVRRRVSLSKVGSSSSVAVMVVRAYLRVFGSGVPWMG